MHLCLYRTMHAADIETSPPASPLAPASARPREAHRPEIDTMPDTPAPAAPPPAPRRFRASDVAEHLDMAVIGDLCVGVSLSGFRTVVGGFLADEAGSLHGLLAALARSDSAALPARAHAVKGAAASMGLRAIQALATELEAAGEQFSPAQCQASAALLQDRVDTVQVLLRRMGFL